MEKSKDIRDCEEYNDPKYFDSPEKVAEWMRKADYAFDFRGSGHWSLGGGMKVMSGCPISIERD